MFGKLTGAAAMGLTGLALAGDPLKDTAMAKSVYDFSVKDIDGKDVLLSKYKGDVCILVNVASL